LVRYDDPSGVSGTGIVAQGVQFRDGQVAVQWCCPDLPRSCAVWESVEDMLRVHGHGGRTVIKWVDEAPVELRNVAGEVCIAGGGGD
jgi:hypothetical protein